MPKQNTTTKQSSGGGFQFENEVGAYVLAHILARSSPFDPQVLKKIYDRMKQAVAAG